MRTRFFGFPAALWLTVSAAPALAQEWRASAQTGRIRSSLDPVATESFALGLQYEGPTAGLRMSGGLPFHSDDLLRGGASAWKRLSVEGRGVRAGLDFSGSAFVAVDRADRPAPPRSPLPGLFNPQQPAAIDRSGRAFSGQAMPVLGYETPTAQFHVRAGVSRYAAAFSGQTGDRSVRLADAQLTLTPSHSLAIVPAVRRFQASGEAASTFTGISAIAAGSPATLWASVGQWSGTSSNGTPWSVGGRLLLHRLVSLEGSVRRDTFDPLYLQPAQTSWSVGLSVLVAGRTRAVAPPVPAAYVNGRATIRLPATASRAQPAIGGDFNDWKPAPMERDGAGWTYSVAVPPGVYSYAFVAGDGTWFVPPGVPGRKDDGMGGHVAVLVVR